MDTVENKMIITTFDKQALLDFISQPSSIVSFDPAITESDLIESLKTIYDYEGTFDIHQGVETPRIMIDLKNVPSATKAQAIKYSISRDDLINPSMIVNIVNLTNGITNLNDSFFADPQVYFTSLIDIVTVKSMILNEVKQFCTTVGRWLISVLKSAAVTEYSVLDEPKKLPRLFECIFLSYDLITLTGYLNNGNPISTDDVEIVENSYFYVVQMCNKNAIANNLFDGFIGNFENDVLTDQCS